MSKTERSNRILQSVGAVFAGVLTIFVLSLGTDAVLHATRVYPPWGEPMADALFVVATIYRIVYAIAGSYITARLARDRPMNHALALGVVGVILSVAGAVATWNAGPAFENKWYPLALIFSALPCAWLGGKLRVMQLR